MHSPSRVSRVRLTGETNLLNVTVLSRAEGPQLAWVGALQRLIKITKCQAMPQNFWIPKFTDVWSIYNSGGLNQRQLYGIRRNTIQDLPGMEHRPCSPSRPISTSRNMISTLHTTGSFAVSTKGYFARRVVPHNTQGKEPAWKRA